MTNSSTPLSTERPESAPPDSTRQRIPPRLFEIGGAFLVIGGMAFGGQGGLLALLSRDLVERRQWIEEAEIAEAFTYVQLLPGAVVVQVVAYLGYRLRRWRGAAVATVCFLLPSVVTMLLLAAAYRRVATVPGVPAALNGLTSAVVGLIALAAYKQARKTVKDALALTIAVGVCAASILGKVNPAVLVVTAGVIGLAREARSDRERRSGSAGPETGEAAP